MHMEEGPLSSNGQAADSDSRILGLDLPKTSPPCFEHQLWCGSFPWRTVNPIQPPPRDLDGNRELSLST